MLEQESANTYQNMISGKSELSKQTCLLTQHTIPQTFPPTVLPISQKKIPAELPNFIIYKILNPGFTYLFNVISKSYTRQQENINS